MNQSTGLLTFRADFPILSSKMRGKDLVYLDNGATSLKPRAVIDAISDYYSSYSANIHRGVYEMSERATVDFDRARSDILSFIGGTERGQLLFTSGATESINLVAFSWAVGQLSSGDEILLTAMEHHSNLVPWQQVCRATGAILKFMDLTPEGTIVHDSIRGAFTDRTRLVAVTGMSNVTGYVPPHHQIIEVAAERGVPVLMDGAQLVAHKPVSVDDPPVDFLVFSAHKMCGPTGMGALFVRNERLAEMSPYKYGGDMIQSVTKNDATWARAPEKFEAGTPNIAGAIGFGAAVRYLQQVGMERIADHEVELGTYLRDSLEALDFVQAYGVPGTGTTSFNVNGVHPHDVGSLLDQQGIAVRTGFHCAQPFMDHFHISGTIRASLYFYNTVGDVDRLVAGLTRVYDIFG